MCSFFVFLFFSFCCNSTACDVWHTLERVSGPSRLRFRDPELDMVGSLDGGVYLRKNTCGVKYDRVHGLVL